MFLKPVFTEFFLTIIALRFLSSFFFYTLTMCLKFIDSEQERKIGVGVHWPFEKLEKNECIISSNFASKGIKVGDVVTY